MLRIYRPVEDVETDERECILIARILSEITGVEIDRLTEAGFFVYGSPFNGKRPANDEIPF